MCDYRMLLEVRLSKLVWETLADDLGYFLFLAFPGWSARALYRLRSPSACSLGFALLVVALQCNLPSDPPDRTALLSGYFSSRNLTSPVLSDFSLPPLTLLNYRARKAMHHGLQ